MSKERVFILILILSLLLAFAPGFVMGAELSNGQSLQLTENLEVYKLKSNKSRGRKIGTLKSGQTIKILKVNKHHSRIKLKNGDVVYASRTALVSMMAKAPGETLTGKMHTPSKVQIHTKAPANKNDEATAEGRFQRNCKRDGPSCRKGNLDQIVIQNIDQTASTKDKDDTAQSEEKRAADTKSKTANSKKIYEYPFGGKYKIKSKYGMRRHPLLGYNKMHTGLDFGAPAGAPIRAALKGKVIHAGRYAGYGIAVIIQHENGQRTLYGHMSKLTPNLKKGMVVGTNTIIGKVGATGLATGPHLHFEVFAGPKGSRRLNPYPLFKGT